MATVVSAGYFPPLFLELKMRKDANCKCPYDDWAHWNDGWRTGITSQTSVEWMSEYLNE